MEGGGGREEARKQGSLPGQWGRRKEAQMGGEATVPVLPKYRVLWAGDRTVASAGGS